MERMACNIPSHGEGSEAIELTYFGEMESAELTLVNLVLWQLAAVVKFVVTPSAMVAAGHSFRQRGASRPWGHHLVLRFSGILASGSSDRSNVAEVSMKLPQKKYSRHVVVAS